LAIHISFDFFVEYSGEDRFPAAQNIRITTHYEIIRPFLPVHQVNVMVQLTGEMKELFAKVKLFPVATSSKKGIPNVTPIAFVLLINDDTIWIADNFMHKTLANVKENPCISVFLYDSDSKKCLQVKGTVDLRTSGDDYEKMKKMVQDKKPGLPAKSLLIMKITEVYDCMPGPSAGKKIL